MATVLPCLPSLDHGGPQASLIGLLPHAPVLLLAVLVTAGFWQAILSLLPIYGSSYDIDEVRLSALLTVLSAGNIALQLPLGFAAERFTARPVLIACSVGTALGCLLLPVLIATPLIWPLGLVLGALSYGIYTMAIIQLGERFSGSMLVAGNAAFALMWGVGGLVGPPATGAIMDVFGVQGLPITLGLLCIALAGAGLGRR